MKKYKIKINGAEYEVNIQSIENNIAHLTVNDVEFEVEVEGIVTNPTRMSTKQTIKSEVPIMQSNTPVVKPQQLSKSIYELKSPLPGVVLDIRVNAGDTVKMGQVGLILEAMKMENNIEIDRGGIVEKVHPAKGDSVLEGDVLFTIKY